MNTPLYTEWVTTSVYGVLGGRVHSAYTTLCGWEKSVYGVNKDEG